MLNIQTLIDDAKWFETVRTLRWPEEVRCVQCRSTAVTRQGRDTTQPERQKYRCGECGRWFDDLTGTVFTGHYARDEDGDGFHEVHVNTIEGVWSLLRSWLRPHRGISQEHLPLYLCFFQFVHNARVRGARAC